MENIRLSKYYEFQGKSLGKSLGIFNDSLYKGWPVAQSVFRSLCDHRRTNIAGKYFLESFPSTLPRVISDTLFLEYSPRALS